MLLWKGVTGDARGAKVSWIKVCRPKSEGRLESRNLRIGTKHVLQSICGPYSVDLIRYG